MDKYIRMMLIKLSPRYKVTVDTQMSYRPDTGRFANACWIKIVERATGHKTNIECHGKREVVKELAKWQHE